MNIKGMKDVFEDSIKIKTEVLRGEYLNTLAVIGDLIATSVLRSGKLMICGNGGSAADAQHLAAELLIRLRPNNNREGIPALALAQDTSTITACGNDFGYEELFARMVRTLGGENDVLLGISTSGNSRNVNLALSTAKEMGIKTVGFLGAGGGKALKYCDLAFIVPSDITGRIQETHITAGHALMEYVEDNLLQSGYLHLQT